MSTTSTMRAYGMRIGPITPDERKAIMAASPLKGKYDATVDSESAYEMLHKRLAETAAPAEAGSGGGGMLDKLGSIVGTIFGTNTPRGRLSTGQVIARFAEGVDLARFATVLSRQSPVELMVRARSLRASQGGTTAAALAKVLVSVYNNRLRTNLLPEWVWTR